MESETKNARPFEPDKTSAAMHKIRSDIARFCKTSGIIINLSLILYYIYSVIANRSNTYLLIINVCILTVITASFLFELFYQSGSKELKRIKKRTKRVFRCMLHSFHTAAAAFAVYEAATFDISAVKMAVTVFMCVGVFVRILSEILRWMVDSYFTLLYQGICMDIEEFKESAPGRAIMKTADTIGNFRATAIELIDKPVSAVARMLNKDEAEEEEYSENSPLSEKEIRQRELLNAIAGERAEESDIRRAEKKAEREHKKQKRLDSSVEKLKTHVSNIFKR